MSNRDVPDGVAPDGPFDPQAKENLVALALGQLAGGEADSVREAVESDSAVAREFEAVRTHLDLHAQVRDIQPMPGGFVRLKARLDADSSESAAAPVPPTARSFLQRYWMSAAAAALLLVALFFPRGGPGAGSSTPTVRDVTNTASAGRAVQDADGNWTSEGLCRIAYGEGVTITLDVDTTLIPIQEQRLALRAGRIFVDVEPGRNGFSVDVGNGRIVTLGTSFLVERGIDENGEIYGRVAVERGRIAYHFSDSDGTVSAGDELRWNGGPIAPQAIPAGAHLRWFEIPSLSAKILNDRTVVVVIRNEMIDPIQLTPPTGGEPLFYATVGNHSYPHEPKNFGRNVVLAPGTDFTFEMKLPQELEPGQEVIIRCPTLGLEAIAESETGR